MGSHPELCWRGYINKKAFKTITKQSWKRRYCQFDAESLTLSWHASEGSKSLGDFVLDPTRLHATTTKEHGKPHEFKIECRGQVFYGCSESESDRQQLLFKVDMARRAKLAGDNGTSLILSGDARIATTADEPGAKVFVWGSGSLLGNGIATAQAWGLPQRNNTFKPPLEVKEVCAGPEHVACVDSNALLYLWGSNEFGQSGNAATHTSHPPPPLFKPIQLTTLGTRKVISIACGGSHTLAVVADAASASGGAVVAWGTGTVGQLGLGDATQFSESPSVVAIPECHGRVVPTTKVYAGIVSSAAVTATGDCFVWGDGSLGRLGLSHITADKTNEKGMPILVNCPGAVVWKPTKLSFPEKDFGVPSGTRLSVTQVALGGAFSMFLLYPVPPGSAAGSGHGCILACCGGIGIDITRDKYGYDEEPSEGGAPTAIDNALEEEIAHVPRKQVPSTVAPFGTQGIVMSINAGARHAAAIVADTPGSRLRLYTAGKGWLGHGTSESSALLPRPTISTTFAPVGGKVADEEVVEAGCGHSHTVVRTASGKAFAWGRGDSGELGHGTMTDRSVPTACMTIEGHRYAQVVTGSYYSAAVVKHSASGTAEKAADITARFQAQSSEEERAINQITHPETAAAATEEAQPLPDGWDYEYDAEGNIYFIAPDGNTQWEDPRDA